MNSIGQKFHNEKDKIKSSSNHKRKFTPEEDEALKILINQVGSLNWLKISELMPGRSAKQCRDRYVNYLLEPQKNEPWKDEEDEIIYSLFTIIGPKWTEISKHIPGRSGNNVKNRWYKHLYKKYNSFNQHMINTNSIIQGDNDESAKNDHNKLIVQNNNDQLTKQYSISSLLI